MKRYAKLFFITLTALICALCVSVGCSGKDSGGQGEVLPPETVTVSPDIYDNANVGGFTPSYGTAYGATPDIDILIDGELNDEVWTDASRKWYTHYEANPRITFTMSTVMSEKGLYIGARSYDPIVTWQGYNCFFKNTNITLQIYKQNGTDVIELSFDANNTKPMQYNVNAFTRYYGELNTVGKGGGLSAEIFLTWDIIGYEVADGQMPEVGIMPIYKYCTKTTASSTTDMLPTFVKTTGNRSQAIPFTKDGYRDGDEQNATVGSFRNGLGKTNGWTVEHAGTDNETASVSANATRGFPNAIFFRDANSSRFKVTATVTAKSAMTDSRAGILIYKDAINYRSIALSYNVNTFKSGKLSSIALNGYTDYPARITITDKMYSDSYNSDKATLTVYNNNGNYYYVLNGKLVYSENVAYIANNSYIGFYAFNTDAVFSDYSIELFDSESEFAEDLRSYAYTVNVHNANSGRFELEADQLAVSNDGGRVNLTMQFAPEYGIGELYYTVEGSDEKIQLIDIAKSGTGGQFSLEVPGNIDIYSKPAKITDGLVTVKLEMQDQQTLEAVKNVGVVLIGSGYQSRYLVRFSGSSEQSVLVPAGESWQYVATANGYRATSGDVIDGEIIDESMTENVPLYIQAAVLGGMARSDVDENGNAYTDYTVASVPGAIWDLTFESEGKAMFQTSNTDKASLYFSGRTISDYQVAYVEITNRTDPSAFATLEADPAAGFIISGENGTTSIAALRQSGLRLIPDRTVFSKRSDVGSLTSYSGTIASTSSGRYIKSVSGYGTVNRIPTESEEYTTSLLMIRHDANLYFYSYNGKAGVRSDGANFDAMDHIYTWNNSAVPGYAAIGLGTTVAYNLRMDFDNYWILVGDEAAEFANGVIGTELSVIGKELVSLDGDAIIDYDNASGKGLVAKSGNLTLTSDSIRDGYMIKVSCNQSVKYIHKGNTTVTYVVDALASDLEITAEEIECVSIKGKVITPDGLEDTAHKGKLYDKLGNAIMSVTTDESGELEMIVQRNAELEIAFELDGYVMKRVGFTASSDGYDLGELRYERMNVGGIVKRYDGARAQSSEGTTFHYSEELGYYVDYVSTYSGTQGIYVASELNNKENMILTMTYERTMKPAGTVYGEDPDPAFGMSFYGSGGCSDVRLWRKGYRVLPNGSYSKAIQKDYITAHDIRTAPVNQPVELKFVKLGTMIYIGSRLSGAEKYELVLAYDMKDDIGSSVATAQISWASYGYYNIRLTDISVTSPEKADLDECLADMNTVKVTIDGTELATLSGDGIIAEDGNVLNVVPQSTVTFKAGELDSGTILKIRMGSAVGYISESFGTADFVCPAEESVSAVIERVTAVTVSGSLTLPESEDLPIGVIYDSSGNALSRFAVRSDGKYSALVQKGEDLFITFELDGYVMKKTAISTDSDVQLPTLEFSEMLLATTIVRSDGVKDSSVSYVSFLVDDQKGAVAHITKESGSYNDGVFIKQDSNNLDNVVISFTFMRRGAPAGSGLREENDINVGFSFYGSQGGYVGVRYWRDGYRIMPNGSLNGSGFMQAEKIATANIMGKYLTDPVDFKLIKVGSIVHMLSKPADKSSYDYIYTYDLSQAVGKGPYTYEIAWFCYGYLDMDVYNLKVEPVSESNSSEIYVAVSASSDGGKTEINGVEITADGARAARGAVTVKVTPDGQKVLSSLTVNGTPVSLDGYTHGEFECELVLNGDTEIVALFADRLYECEAKVTYTQTQRAKTVKAECNGRVIEMSISAIYQNLSGSVAVINAADRTLTVLLPAGEWTLTLYDASGATAVGNPVQVIAG